MNFLPSLRAHPWRFALAAALVGAVLAAVVSMSLPPRYQVSLAFTVNQPPRPATSDFGYDGYYALQASSLFADTLISWFATPAVISDIYASAGYPLSGDEAVKATGRFSAKRFSSQNVIVKYSDSDRERAQAIARAAIEVVSKRTSQLNTDSKGAPLFVIMAAEPVVSRTDLPPGPAAAVGFLLGAVLAGLWLYLSTPPKGAAA